MKKIIIRIFVLTFVVLLMLPQTLLFGKSETVETNKILYQNDFSNDQMTDFTIVQQTSGATIGIVDGNLILNASNAANSYIRVLLPEHLSSQNNYKISIRATITNQFDAIKWMSIMFNVQNNDYPYSHFCIRQNAAANNGTEYAEKNSQNAWNVLTTIPYIEQISKDKYYDMSVYVYNNKLTTIINDTVLTNTDILTEEKNGRMGFQVRGVSAKIDSIEITETTEPYKTVSSYLNDVSMGNKNIILPPTVVNYIDNINDYNSIDTNKLSTAVFYINDDAQIVDKDGGKIATLEEAKQKLDNKVIPAYYIKSTNAVPNICEFYSKDKPADAFVISENKDVLKAVRAANPQLSCVLDATNRPINSNDDLLLLREDANVNYARTIIIPLSASTIANVEYLQKLFITVWVECLDNSNVSLVTAATAGANGIVGHGDFAKKLDNVFNKYFNKSSMLRMPNIIGHRGVPSLGQENTVAGSVTAAQQGALFIENDVYLTSDGVAVVMHDAKIDRTTNGTGNIINMTYEQLSKFSVNINSSCKEEPIPKLEDYFIEFKGQDNVILIEIKHNAPGVVAEVIRLIKEHDMASQVNIITFNLNQLLEIKQLMPEMSVGYLTSDIILSENDYLTSVETVLSKTLIYESTYNPSYSKGPLGYNFMIAAAHRGITVWPWTINDQAMFDKYFMMGTYGITTNFAQYASTYTKRIDVDNELELKLGESITPEINKVSYSGEKTKANVEMLIIDGNETLKYKDGILNAEIIGDATVIFRFNAKTSSNNTYYIYSQPTIIKIANSDLETTIAEDTTVQTEITQSGCQCGKLSVILLPILIVASSSAFIIKKRI